MSRIVGLVAEKSNGNARRAVERMADVSKTSPSWSVTIAGQDAAYLGSCGWNNPNIFSSGGILVVMDGDIYNGTELGNATNDAELFIMLYRKYGFVRALQLLNGDFALSLFDHDRNETWLARDRFGVKPLYFAKTEQYFAFASRPRALLTLSGISNELNRQFVGLVAASHYRYFDNNPEQSPYVDIEQLPAATAIRYADGQINRWVYWSLTTLPDFVDSEKYLSEQYRDVLMDAVKIRLGKADNPAFTLSGGMDSSSVLGSAVKASGEKQHAFSTVYVDKTYDESLEIRSMLETTVKQWHPVPIENPDVIELIKDMIEIHDEPVATATWLSHYVLCQEASQKGFEGLFGGLGGDELNAGEYEYFFFYFADLYRAGEMNLLATEIDYWARYHDHPIFRKSQSVVDESFTRLVDFSRPGRCLPDRTRIDRYKHALNPDYFDLDSFEPIMETPFDSYLKNRTYQDITRETIPCCLRAEDRNATAFGLNNFLPFLDHRLVEFMFRVPGELKYRNGVTKYLLREAMTGILPEETRNRVKKTGWNAPAHMWFSGQGGDMLLDLVHSQAFRERGIYSVPEVERLISDHQKIVTDGLPIENHMMFFWQLVNLELWFQSLESV